MKDKIKMWNLEKNNANVAMIDENEQSIRYADIQMIIEKIDNVCGQRDVVSCLCKNIFGSIIGYLAFIELHIVPILLEASIEKSLMKKVCINYEPYYIWAPEEMYFEEYCECISFLGYLFMEEKRGKSSYYTSQFSGLAINVRNNRKQ